MGVPLAVATDGAVHLTHRLGRSSAGALVNAVLRRAGPAWSAELGRAAPDVRLSHPEWLYRRWASGFGADAAVRAMEADQEPAPLWVWFVDDTAAARLERSGVALEPHPWCPGAFRALERAGDLAAAVADGAAYAQDPSSQLVSHLGGRLDLPGGRFADLCAAPGGKSARLLTLARWNSCVALDVSLVRARLMEPLLGRSGGCPIAVADATRPPLARGGLDLILLDAPCTGTGTLRRHPELRWRLQPAAITQMAAVQRMMLSAAQEAVSEGGVLLYATCSVEAEENEAHFPSTVDGFAMVDLSAVLPGGVPWVPTGAGGVRILPHLDGDGFTIHALRRVSG